jgi:hypothetical protein
MAPRKLNQKEYEFLTACCDCAPYRGLMAPPEYKKAATSLLRKGLLWNLGFSDFRVYIATEKGRKLCAELHTNFV